jgi:hypothetical protein
MTDKEIEPSKKVKGFDQFITDLQQLLLNAL